MTNDYFSHLKCVTPYHAQRVGGDVAWWCVSGGISYHIGMIVVLSYHDGVIVYNAVILVGLSDHQKT